jgi:beta-1,4-N-acetylglucosaminyltransferase
LVPLSFFPWATQLELGFDGGHTVIFVTVGTSDFDQLVERIDELAPFLHDQVLVQIGNGKYIPRNCEYFRFAPSLAPYYDEADVVVAHGGLGTTMEVLEKGKKLICVENTTCIDDHQTDILGVLAGEGYLIWCRDLDELPSLLERAPAMNPRSYVPPPCRIAEVIQDFLRKLE